MPSVLGIEDAMTGPSWRVRLDVPSSKVIVTGPTGVDGVHVMVKFWPAVRLWPSVGAVNTSKLAVWASTLEAAASAQRHHVLKDNCMMIERN